MGEPETVIRVSELSKRYVISRNAEKLPYRTLRDTLAGGAANLGRRLIGRQSAADPGREEFWALKNVSFEVKRGEVVGIIGRNGAGKSTLLKILSRITEPTSGEVELNGRVASLLEVGTGFHPELTGRENIYLNGSILGMSRAEVKRKFDEIVAFAEVEKFLDTPVKRYSSGMYVRLAFAVAAHLEPEILIVDEVLAVGDAGFQKKCLGKMGEVARGGRTVLFVSHDLAALRRLCSSAVHLDSGRLIGQGESSEVVATYLRRSSAVGRTVRGDGVELLDVQQLGPDGDQVEASDVGRPWGVRVVYRVERDLRLGASLRVMDGDGAIVLDAHEFIRTAPIRPAGTYTTDFRFIGLPLAPRQFGVTVDLMVHHGPHHLKAENVGRLSFVGGLTDQEGVEHPFDVAGVLHARPIVHTCLYNAFTSAHNHIPLTRSITSLNAMVADQPEAA